MRRVAAIDCGTNTVRLLVVDLDPATGAAVERVRESRIVRLGQGVDRTGMLAEAALARVFAALEQYAAVVADYHVEALRVGATSAARDAANAEEFVRGVEERLGVRPDILTGADEAALTFAGAVGGLAAAAAAADAADTEAPVLVVDVGGGSTEVVLDGAGVSLDLGSVRLTERHVRTDPPAAAEVAAVRAEVDAALDAARAVDLGSARTVVAVSGTGLTLAAGVLAEVGGGDRLRSIHDVDGAVVSVDDVRRHVARLLGLTVAQRRALPFMEPGRADVIGVGGLILERVLARTGVTELRVSVHDVLDGLAWSLVDPGPAPPSDVMRVGCDDDRGA